MNCIKYVMLAPDKKKTIKRANMIRNGHIKSCKLLLKMSREAKKRPYTQALSDNSWFLDM